MTPGNSTMLLFLAGMLTLAIGTPTFRSHLVLFRVGGCVNCASEVGTSGELYAVTEAKLPAGWSGVFTILWKNIFSVCLLIIVYVVHCNTFARTSVVP